MRRFLPSLSALVAFESAGRHGSFTKAAEDLSITQSGISRQIGNLESFLGVRLFERIGSRIVLTHVGNSYLDEISQVLDQIERASIDTVRGRKLDDRFLICTYPTLSSRWLTPRLQGFLSANPALMVEITTATQGIDFETTDIDVAILRGRGSWRGAVSFELFKEQIAVVASPRLIAPGTAPAHLDFDALPTLQNASRPDLWITWLRQSQVPHSGAIQGPRLPQSEMLIAAAVNGIGLAVVPLPFVERELASGDLWMPFGAAVPSEDSYWLVYSEHSSDSTAAMAFKAWLQRELKRAGAR